MFSWTENEKEANNDSEGACEVTAERESETRYFQQQLKGLMR